MSLSLSVPQQMALVEATGNAAHRWPKGRHQTLRSLERLGLAVPSAWRNVGGPRYVLTAEGEKLRSTIRQAAGIAP